MVMSRFTGLLSAGAWLCLPIIAEGAAAPQSPVSMANPRWVPEQGMTFAVQASAGQTVRVERANGFAAWTPFQTLRSTGTNRVEDGLPHADPTAALRFYRALALDAPALTGDHLQTDAGDLVLHPINHASLVLRWQERMIYVDPVGGAAPYQDLPRADLILITHSHGDHFNAATLEAVRGPEVVVVAPAAVYTGLASSLKSQAVRLANGESVDLLDLTIEAVPAYNANHPRGAGNGYVLGIGGRRLYFSGDTGDIPETRALTGIDVAFLCMNTPFTMNVTQAAEVTRAFRPAVLYPYHYRNQDGTFTDLNRLRQLIGTDLGIEVRTRDWY